MQVNFTLKDLNDAFNLYCEYSIEYLKRTEQMAENRLEEEYQTLKAVNDFVNFFRNKYICRGYLDSIEDDLTTIFDKYKKHFSKSYDVIVYGQEIDASTADPVELKGVIAADKEELERMLSSLSWEKGGIFVMSGYDILNKKEVVKHD